MLTVDDDAGALVGVRGCADVETDAAGCDNAGVGGENAGSNSHGNDGGAKGDGGSCRWLLWLPAP